ncbi:hypothetical protein [Niastella populi]|uniref:Uncharacterized protein n=1 Tax=Niastella populi TaxID=550983 RepID=A0A1V9GD88_9BACT|nr:hypothetical protein [Niastella populi]OQP68418.1 hypothetical protein A4R26_01005 [Niastella populi]
MMKLLTPIVLIGVLILNTQCGPTIRITENDKDQLDPNFAGYTGTLLVIKNRDNNRYNSFDRYTIKGLRKYYKGDFIIIREKDLSKYSDLDKYRFLVRAIVIGHYGGNFNGRAVYDDKSHYYMKDRKTQKEYKTREYTGYMAMDQFPIAIEALRVSKQKEQ